MSSDIPRRDEDRLLEVAAALADGSRVDWQAHDDADAETSRILRRLQSIERLSEAFRHSEVTDETQTAAADARRIPLFTWGHLEALELIGSGGFGQVYRAWDPMLDREVALKLRRAGSSSSPAADHEIDEARRLARVRHPNVVTVYGVAIHGGIAGFWCDLIHGQTLEGLLTERGPFGAGEVVAIGTDLCRGLSALHAAGVVHGDVKTTNVMREQGGRIVLMDLGASRLAGVAVSGPVYGTPSVTAHEVLQGEPPSAASDLYSLGALLFRLVTGRNHCDPESGATLRDLRPDIPPRLLAVIDRALSRAAAARFSSAGAMGQALQNAMVDHGGSAWPVAQRLNPQIARRVAIAVAVLAAAAIAVFTLTDIVQVPTDRGLRIGRLRSMASSGGSVQQGALSPDGRRVAFISDASGHGQVWIQDVAGGSLRRLTDVERAVARPSWLPDGSRIVFTAWGSIWSVSPDGGAPSKLLDNAWNATVGSRTGLIVFERRDEIWTAALDGSDVRKVEGIPAAATRIAERRPALSPDESLIAFMHAEARPWGDVWVVPTAGGSPRRLTAEGKAFGKPAWSSDGRTVVFPSRRAGGLTLWQVDAARALEHGPQPSRPLLQSEGEETEPMLSDDGRTLLFTANRNSYALAMLDPVTGAERTLRESRLHLMSPVVSKAGRIAFFGWGRDGEMHVFTMGLDGGTVQQVTSAEDGESTFPIWSADGRELFFYRATSEPSWRRVPAEGGTSIEVKGGWTATDRDMIRLDPTGLRAAYTWYDRDIPRVTRIADLTTGAEREFHRLLRYASFSPDARWIVGVDATPNPVNRIGPLVACPIEPGPCRPLAPFATRSKVSADGRTVFFQRPLRAYHGCELWSVRIDGSGAKKLHTFTTEVPYLPAFDVASSGEIVLQRFQPSRHELWLADLER